MSNSLPDSDRPAAVVPARTIALALGAALAFGLMALWLDRRTGAIVCFPTGANGWTFECDPGAGEERADEQFPPTLIAVAVRQGNDLNRSFRGSRWLATVEVERGAGSVKAGSVWKMYGTVERIDGSRIYFRDCVFAK